MANDENDEEVVENEGETEETEGTAPPEPPEGKGDQEAPILGKFKSVDDLTKSYQELERELTEKATKLSQYEQQGGGYSTQQTPPDGTNYWEERFDTQHPAQATAEITQAIVSQAMGQFQQQFQQSQANIKRVVSGKRKDAMFDQVEGEFEAALGEIPPAYMADPNSSQQLGDRLYAEVVGRRAMKLLQEAKEDPKKRLDIVKALGVEEPEGTHLKTKADEVDDTGLAMLRGIGVARGKETDAVMEAYVKKGEEE